MSVTPERDRPTAVPVVGDLAIPAPRSAPAYPPPVSPPARREASPPGSTAPEGRRLHLDSVAAELEATANGLVWALRLALLGAVGLVLLLLLA